MSWYYRLLLINWVQDANEKWNSFVITLILNSIIWIHIYIVPVNFEWTIITRYNSVIITSIPCLNDVCRWSWLAKKHQKKAIFDQILIFVILIVTKIIQKNCIEALNNVFKVCKYYRQLAQGIVRSNNKKEITNIYFWARAQTGKARTSWSKAPLFWIMRKTFQNSIENFIRPTDQLSFVGCPCHRTSLLTKNPIIDRIGADFIWVQWPKYEKNLSASFYFCLTQEDFNFFLQSYSPSFYCSMFLLS